MNSSKTARDTFVWTIWSLIFFSCFIYFMRQNYEFHILDAEHWQWTWHQWWHEGWVIQGSYYYSFLIALFLCIPIWIMGGCFFVSLDYKKIYEKCFWSLIYKSKMKAISTPSSKIILSKKKSYKEIRPLPLSSLQQTSVGDEQLTMSKNDMVDDRTPNDKSVSIKEKLAQNSTSVDFASDDTFSGSSPFNAPVEQKVEDVDDVEFAEDDVEAVFIDENIPEIMKQAGATVLEQVSIGRSKVDYVGISKACVHIVLLDDVDGDWLADEERFNDEDPLWFSETDHRISPIVALKKFETNLMKKTKTAGVNLKTHIVLVKTKGNICNVDDMQEIWNSMNVSVVRSSFGQPMELPVFGSVFAESLKPETNLQKIESLFDKFKKV